MKKLALLLLSAVALSGCQTALITHKEALLESAGFKATPADTPERKAMMTSLPAREFVQGVQGLSVAYLYADPQVCNCVYVGSAEAYSKYQGRVQFVNGSHGPPGSFNNTSSNEIATARR